MFTIQILNIVYMILELFSSTCIYLLNKKSSTAMNNYMREIFNLSPEIKYHCKCYHFSYDNTVYSYKEYFNLPYYSSRDISGPFKPNCDKNLIKKKNLLLN